MGDIGGVPAREVERVEARAVVEHVVHDGDLGGVPSREVERVEARAAVEHIVHAGDIAGIDFAQVHARAVCEITEQLRAVAGEAHLVGGCDARDCRGRHFAAPLVGRVELAPDKCQRAGRAVEGVARHGNKVDGHDGVLEGHLEGVALDGVAVHAVARHGMLGCLAAGEGDGAAGGVEVHVAVGECGGRRGGHTLGQGEGEHAREVTRLGGAVVNAGIFGIGVAGGVDRAVAAHQRGAAGEHIT